MPHFSEGVRKVAGVLMQTWPNGAAFGVGSPAETAQQPSGMAGLLGGAFNTLGLLAKRSIGSSEMMRRGGAYDPAPMVEAAMLPMGTGAIAGVPLRVGEAVLGSGVVRRAPVLPENAQKAFDLGRLVRDVRESYNGSGRSFYEDWAYGRLPKLSSDSADLVAGWEMNSPLQNGFYQAGRHGDVLPELTGGTRFGNAPKEGRSWNYREQEYEPGVSMATADHPNFADFVWPDPFNKDRPLVAYQGYLLPMKGSDDEPLMVGLKAIGARR